MSMKMKLKKTVMSILCMVLLCSLTACSSPQKEESDNDISVTTDTDITESTTQDIRSIYNHYVKEKTGFIPFHSARQRTM